MNDFEHLARISRFRCRVCGRPSFRNGKQKTCECMRRNTLKTLVPIGAVFTFKEERA